MGSAAAVGGAGFPTGRRPLPPTAQPFDLAESVAAAGLTRWAWDPDSDELDVVPAPGGPIDAGVGPTPARLADLLDLVHPGDRAAIERALRGCLQTRTAFRVQFRLLEAGSGAPAAPATGASPPTPELDPQDGPLIVRMLGNATERGGRRWVSGVLEDVTVATRERQALTQNQRLASLGQLAAGIAHDFNNVLTVVTMRADLLRSTIREEGAGSQSEDDVVAILDAAARASALTRQLMLFAGHQGARPVEVEVGEVVRALRPLVDAMREGLFTTDYDIGPCPPVRTDRVHLEQILVNLALNARDALREVPRPAAHPLVLTVRVRAGAADPSRRGDPAGLAAARSWVVLEVTDTGVGMDAVTHARALDPFFTTKPVGAGTGLGLSVVHGLVEGIGGRMSVDSVRGQGTTVRVVLPGSRLVPIEPVARPPARPARARTRLVLVDDDEAVRAVTSRSLTMSGFEVVQAAGARQALDALAHEPDIAALVSDIVMPEMSGTELAARVLRDFPTVPVLLVTGYTPPTEVVNDARLSLVTKPLTGAKLAQSLRELLDRVAAVEPAAGA